MNRILCIQFKLLEDLGIDAKIILEWILKGTGCEGVDWMPLAQCRVQ
jgi:hypothetical protein